MEEFLKELANLLFPDLQIILNYNGVAEYEQKLAGLYYGANLTSLSTERMTEIIKRRMDGFSQYIEQGFASMMSKCKSSEEQKWLIELQKVKQKYYDRFMALLKSDSIEESTTNDIQDWVTYDELREKLNVRGLTRINDATWRKKNGFTAYRQPCGKGSAVVYSIRETKNWFETNGLKNTGARKK